MIQYWINLPTIDTLERAAQLHVSTIETISTMVLNLYVCGTVYITVCIRGAITIDHLSYPHVRYCTATNLLQRFSKLRKSTVKQVDNPVHVSYYITSIRTNP
jgi:hypothetical protein